MPPRVHPRLMRRLALAVLLVGGLVAAALALADDGSGGRPATRAALPATTTNESSHHTLGAGQGAVTTVHPAAPTAHPQRTSGQGLARMLGQMIVARFAGGSPPTSFLSRIRAGEIGGVILFSDNVAGGVAATRRLTSQLQRAAREGGNPPLLIMADQEGGEVKRLPGPPSLAPADMKSGPVAFAQGRGAGALLRSAGVDVDLAPVADVEQAPGSFLGTRSFGSSPGRVARRACAFARGLASEHVAYTLKHFPGLGLATGNTDLRPVSVQASAETLRSGYAAYRACGQSPVALVMVSSAIYPSLAGSRPAVMSPEIYRRELLLAVRGATPTTISDDLESPAVEAEASPARQAINAGLDLLLYAQSDGASAYAYSKLLSEARHGAIPRSRLAAAAGQIRALKRGLTH